MPMTIHIRVKSNPFPRVKPHETKSLKSSESHGRTYRHGQAKFCNISRMLTSKDPRDSLFQEGSSRFLFGRGPSACPLVFPLCLVFPPVDRHSRLDLSHYYTRFSYYTRHPFYFEANVERSLRAATLGSRFTPMSFLRFRSCSFPLTAILSITDTAFPWYRGPLSALRALRDYHYDVACGRQPAYIRNEVVAATGLDLSRPYLVILIFRIPSKAPTRLDITLAARPF